MTALPAGPELDRLVAERVMGWKPITDDLPDMWVTADGSKRYTMSNVCAGFYPSRDIAHAWEAVERMRELGFTILLDSFRGGDDPSKTGWLVSWEDEAAHTTAQVGAITAPWAISLAALATVGGGA